MVFFRAIPFVRRSTATVSRIGLIYFDNESPDAAQVHES
jgi:hypothetical protein